MRLLTVDIADIARCPDCGLPRKHEVVERREDGVLHLDINVEGHYHGPIDLKITKIKFDD